MALSWGFSFGVHLFTIGVHLCFVRFHWFSLGRHVFPQVYVGFPEVVIGLAKRSHLLCLGFIGFPPSSGSGLIVIRERGCQNIGIIIVVLLTCRAPVS